MMGGFGGGMGGSWIWPLMLVAGLVVLVWGLMHARSGSADGSESRAGHVPQGRNTDQARDILRERYARGEISEDELRERMRVLDGG
ncbi:MAG TPA: SHOCT domain-containing protein [Marmoricola sp.]|nr:SHOCT domain-containing protein [Marmoricola sp.]